MSNRKFIKEDLPIIWFLTGHILKIILYALPWFLVGCAVLEYVFKNLSNIDINLSMVTCDFLKGGLGTFTNYFIALPLKEVALVAIIALVSIFYSHISILNNYVPKKFILKGADGFLKDFGFIFIWLGASIIYSLYMLCLLHFPITALKYVSIYFVQNVIFYILIRKKHFGYDIKKRSSVIDI